MESFSAIVFQGCQGWDYFFSDLHSSPILVFFFLKWKGHTFSWLRELVNSHSDPPYHTSKRSPKPRHDFIRFGRGQGYDFRGGEGIQFFFYDHLVMRFNLSEERWACQLTGSRSLHSTHHSGHLREKKAILQPKNRFHSCQKAQWPSGKKITERPSGFTLIGK